MAQLVEFASNHLLLVSGLIGTWLVVMFYEMRLKAQTMTSVGTTDSVRLINKGAIVIDVRSSDSYKKGILSIPAMSNLTPWRTTKR